MQGKQLSAAHQTPSPAVRLANDGHLSCPCVHLADTHGSISCLELYQENVAVSRPTQPSDHGSDKFEVCWYNSCAGDYDLCNVSAGGHCICHRHSSCPGRLLGLPQPALSPVAGSATVGFFLYGPQMLIGLCGAEVVSPSAVGASQGFLGWISYLGQYSFQHHLIAHMD